jgi:hypothetical protein
MEPLDTKSKDPVEQPSEDSPTSSAQVPTTSSSEQKKKPASIPDPEADSISPNDVLLGRGGGTNRHVGNIYFRDLVSSRQPAYVQARKMDKTLIAKSIVAHIRERNGRFLKNVKGSWIDVGDQKAAEKTSQALREGLSGRMREVVKEGGVGLSQLKQIGYSIYEDDITRDGVQKRVQSIQNKSQEKEKSKEDERKPPSSGK